MYLNLVELSSNVSVESMICDTGRYASASCICSFPVSQIQTSTPNKAYSRISLYLSRIVKLVCCTQHQC